MQWTRSAATRLRVARETLVGVEAGTKTVVRAVGHDLDFGKPALPILKERCFVRGKAVKRAAGACRTTAHAGVYRTFPGLSQAGAASGQCQGNDCTETLERISPDNSHVEPPSCTIDLERRNYTTGFFGRMPLPWVSVSDSKRRG
jgi:hypothetical protein